MIRVISVIGFLLVSWSLIADNNQANAKEQLAFDGAMTPSQIIAELYADRIHQEAGSLTVEITVPIIRNKQVMVQDTSGLPLRHNNSGQQSDEATITVPFSIDLDISKKGKEDFNTFLDGMDTMLVKLQASSDFEESACGGIPLSSQITDTLEKGLQDCESIATTLSCLNVDGHSDWYFEKQSNSFSTCQ